MKKYFVKYGRFGNEYEVVFTTSAKKAGKAVADGFSEITAENARELTKSERERRKYDNAFSGYASARIEEYEG